MGSFEHPYWWWFKFRVCVFTLYHGCVWKCCGVSWYCGAAWLSYEMAWKWKGRRMSWNPSTGVRLTPHSIVSLLLVPSTHKHVPNCLDVLCLSSGQLHGGGCRTFLCSCGRHLRLLLSDADLWGRGRRRLPPTQKCQSGNYRAQPAAFRALHLVELQVHGHLSAVSQPF